MTCIIDSHTRRHVEVAFQNLRDGDPHAACDHLKESGIAEAYHNDYLKVLRQAIRENNYDLLQPFFRAGSFVSRAAAFVFVAPYRVWRKGRSCTLLSGILGVVTVDTPSDALVKAAINEFGAMPTPPASVLGYRSLSSFGLAGGAAGEAFLVPNAWRFHGALEGPALNDISEQNQRYRISALWLKTIFASGTFDFVSAPITDTISGNSLRNEEFQFHEVAHVVGA